MDGVLNGTILCPVQELDGENVPMLNSEGETKREETIMYWRDLYLQAQVLIFSTTETVYLIFRNHFQGIQIQKSFFSTQEFVEHCWIALPL